MHLSKSVKREFTQFSCLMVLSLLSLLTACGGGGSGSGSGGVPASAQPQIVFELADPTPRAGDFFGQRVAILGNGNIVVTDPFDSSIAARNGAVHLYSSLTRTVIASIYGDAADDELGRGGITVLGNNNFVITSPEDDEAGIVDAGSVRLVDGNTGLQIGATLMGNTAGDKLGSSGITALGNGNFVITSPEDDDAGIVDAGSVRLVDGATGVPLGVALVGDVTDDLDGVDSSDIAVLDNGNFVVAFPSDDVGGVVDAGSVRLIDGATGVPIGVTVVGDIEGDQLGSGVTVLGNNKFVIASSSDTEDGVDRGGSVRLVDGVTGMQIGAPLKGDMPGDRLGGSIAVLPNNNYVITSTSDDEGGVINAGSVRLVDGVTGVQIGATLAGDVAGDRLGYARLRNIVALANNNFVVASQLDDEGGIINAGSVRLVSGVTGAQIGATYAGDAEDDQLGRFGVIALANSNFIVALVDDDVGGVVDAGSVRLVNGVTGAQMGITFAGDVEGDQLGSGGIIALTNNNFVIASGADDVGGIVDAGSVRLINGATGEQIGTTLAGDVENDRLGGVPLSGSIRALGNNNFVIASPEDDEGGVFNVGSVRLVNGATGVQIGAPLIGEDRVDQLGDGRTTALRSNNFVTVSRHDDEGGVVDAGSVRLVDGVTGAQIGPTLAGRVKDDVDYVGKVVESAAGDFFILVFNRVDHNGLVDSGLVRLVLQ